MPCDMDEEEDDEQGKTWEEGPGSRPSLAWIDSLNRSEVRPNLVLDRDL
jgi:hypothetical protein